MRKRATQAYQLRSTGVHCPAAAPESRIVICPSAPGDDLSAAKSGVSEILTLTEAALFLRMSKAHLSHLVNGKLPRILPIPHARIGRRIIFRKESLDRWLEVVEQSGSHESVPDTPERKNRYA